MLSKMREFFSHIWAYDISTMAHVLKRFDPDNSSPFHCPDETPEPEISHELEIPKGEQDDNGCKNEDKLKKSESMPDYTNHGG